MSFNDPDFLAPKEIAVLDMIEPAKKLERRFGDVFVAPEPGIYVKGMFKPVIHSGDIYYDTAGYKTGISLNKLDNVTTDVLNKDGIVIIPAYIIRNQKKMLSTKPSFPISAINVIRYIAEDIISQMVVYPSSSFCTNIKKFVKPEHHDLVDEGMLEAASQKFVNDVMMFVSNDIWNMYSLRQTNGNLIIEKLLDYRVYEWTRIMEDGMLTE